MIAAGGTRTSNSAALSQSVRSAKNLRPHKYLAAKKVTIVCTCVGDNHVYFVCTGCFISKSPLSETYNFGQM